MTRDLTEKSPQTDLQIIRTVKNELKLFKPLLKTLLRKDIFMEDLSKDK